MVNTRIIVLNSNQVSALLHDFIVDNVQKIFNLKKVVSTGTYILLDKDNPKMLCKFSQTSRNIILNIDELDKLLVKLPNTGFNCFEMSNKQIEEVINCNHKINLKNIKFKSEKLYKTKNCLLFTLGEQEMREILYKQIFWFVSKIVGFQSNDMNINLKINFNGEKSELIFAYSYKPFNIDLLKLNLIKEYSNFSNPGFDYKFFDLNENELNEFAVKS